MCVVQSLRLLIEVVQSREERKLQAALAAFERKEEKEKRKAEAHKDSGDAKEKRVSLLPLPRAALMPGLLSDEFPGEIVSSREREIQPVSFSQLAALL